MIERLRLSRIIEGSEVVRQQASIERNTPILESLKPFPLISRKFGGLAEKVSDKLSLVGKVRRKLRRFGRGRRLRCPRCQGKHFSIDGQCRRLTLLQKY